MTEAKKEKKQDEALSVSQTGQALPPISLPKDEKALAELLKPAPGTEEVSSEDVIMPRIRLLQDQSIEVKAKEQESGLLKNSITGEIFTTFDFIPLTMHKSRTMFDVDNRMGAPLCRSNDTKIGSDGSKCAECSNAQWKEGKPPVCNMIFNYLVIQPKEIGIMFLPNILSFMKTSAQSALKINVSVECTLPRQPFWNKVWRVTPKLKPFKRGPAYILEVQQLRDTTADERMWAELVYRNTIGKKIDLTADDMPTDDLNINDLEGA